MRERPYPWQTSSRISLPLNPGYGA